MRWLLEHPADLADALASRRRDLAAEIAGQQARLKRLDALRATLTEAPTVPAIGIREIEPALALTSRDTVRTGDGRITALFEALELRAAREGGRANASPFLLLHGVSGRRRQDVEACVPIRPEGAGLAGARRVEGHERAGTMVFGGAYAGTRHRLATLSAWVRAGGGAIGGPLREVYHRFGADQCGYRLPARMIAAAPADYITELQAPIVEESP